MIPNPILCNAQCKRWGCFHQWFAGMLMLLGLYAIFH